MNIERLKELFIEEYGGGGDIRLYFSPGRVNLIGDHTDYNGGHVFPCAIARGTRAVARKRNDRIISFYSVNVRGGSRIDVTLDDLEYNKDNWWANYPIGVVWAFAKRGMKLDKGFDFMMWGNIPNGAGLSSSASIEVLVAIMLKDLYGFNKLSKTDIALIGQYSENNYNGCSCGIMDQFAVAHGKRDYAIYLDTSTLKFEYAPVVLNDASIVITNSNVKHKLVDGQYNSRRDEAMSALKCLQKRLNISSLGELSLEELNANADLIENEVLYRRAKHAVTENIRVKLAFEALKNNDISRFGQLMNESHFSLRDDYEVSCEEVDELVDIALSTDGVLGSRMTGGGFGGCTVSIIKDDMIEHYEQEIDREYKKRTGRDATIYIASIGAGAHRIRNHG